MSLHLPSSFIAGTNVTCIWQPGELFTRAGSGRDIAVLGGASAARLSQSWVAVSFVPPANQPTKVLWSPESGVQLRGREKSCGRPSAASRPGEARDTRDWGEMGITSGLDTPRPAPRGPEVTGEPSAARYFQPPLGAAARAGCRLPPPPQRPAPPSQGQLRGHPFPSSILFPGTERDWREGDGCSPSQNESGPGDTQALNRPGLR